MDDQFPTDDRPSTVDAVLAGVAVGMGAIGLYLVAGLAVVGWDVGETLARVSPGMVARLAFVGLVVVAAFAVPVTAYLRWGLVTPLVVFGVVLVGWLVLGAAQGVLFSETVFALALYAFVFSPFYVLAYLVVGSGEYLARRWRAPVR